MDKADRKTRLAIVSAMLLRQPGKLYSLKVFCDMFGAAKSTMSEDIAILRSLFKKYAQGDIEVSLGAGGARGRRVPARQGDRVAVYHKAK